MAFVKRILNATFKLGNGPFGTDGFDTVELEGLRISANITKAGGYAMATLAMRVYGMTRSQMERLYTLGLVTVLVKRNYITLQAGDEGAGQLATVFVGTITNGWIDLQAQPDVAFVIEAHEGLIEAIKPGAPRSFPGPTDINVVMQSIASEMNYNFESNVTSCILPTPYFYGSPRNQAQAAAQQGNIEMILDNGTLAIWPKGAARNGTKPLVNSTSGLVGYPAYTSKGISLKSIYNPTIVIGTTIKVESSLGVGDPLDTVNGDWNVYSLSHDLESNFPNGQWFTSLEASRPALGVKASRG